MGSKIIQRVASACDTFGHDIFYAMLGGYFMIFVTSNLFTSPDAEGAANFGGQLVTIMVMPLVLYFLVY